MNKHILSTALVALLVGLAAGYFVRGPSSSDGANADAVADSTAAEPLFYRNPMNPSVTSPVPAQDSMGMDYIPVYAEGDSAVKPGTVTIDPVVKNNIGLRTAVVESKTMSRAIRTLGRVDYDEENLVRLHPKVEGWIRDIRIDKTGQPVANDDILLEIYSPKLVSTQQEYLLALNNLAALENSPFDDIREGARALAESSRERLVLLDVPQHQIVEIEQSRKVMEGLHIHAPARGTVLKVGARQGQYVTPATELYLIADLGTVWVYADIYDYELPWIKQGDRVEMTLASVPGRVFEGELAYIFPYAEAMTRTTKVRLVFDNPDQLLRPEMFAEVLIKASEQSGQLVVPAQAIVRTGDYNQVFVVTETGALEPRRVRLGMESQGEVSLESGVSAGERVVVSAQFLVDSESSLREAAAKMMAMPDAEHADHDMSGHDMSGHDMNGHDMNGHDRNDPEMNHDAHEGMQHD